MFLDLEPEAWHQPPRSGLPLGGFRKKCYNRLLDSALWLDVLESLTVGILVQHFFRVLSRGGGSLVQTFVSVVPPTIFNVLLFSCRVQFLLTSASSAKRSPFSPTPFCKNVHKSGFFPPVESYSLNLNFTIISTLQKREIHVRKRSSGSPSLRAF